MVNLDIFYTNIVLWIQTYVKKPSDVAEGIICIRAQQNSPRPNDELFCVLDVTNFVQKGRASIETIDTATNEKRYSYHGTLILSIDFYGVDALKSAYTLRATMDHELTSSFFDTAGAGVFSVGDVLDITSLKDSRFEERARFELGMNVVFSSSEVVEWIESVEINGKTIEI